MSQADAKGNLALRFVIAIIVVAFFGGVGLIGVALIMPKSSPLPAVSAPVAPAIPVSSAPQPEAPAQPVFVDLFDPTSLIIKGPQGELLNTPLAPAGGQTTGVLNPVDPQLPNMLLDDGRTTRPGTDQGTVLVIGHSRLNDEGNRFNKLMDLPNPLNRGDYQATLSGNGGLEVTYDLETVLDIEKAVFGSREYRYLQNNQPGRILLITSWVKGTYPPPERARIVIGCDSAHPGCSAPQ